MKNFLIERKGAILFVALFSLLFAINSCVKEKPVRAGAAKSIKLSQDIFDYDLVVRNQVRTVAWTEKDTKQLLILATADLKSAWEAFKLVSKVLTPGYGGAAALLAGIGGSLYTWWLTKDETKSAKIDNPYTPAPNTVTPANIGKWHNYYLHQEIIRGAGASKDLDYMVNNTYNSLLENVSSTFGYMSQDLSSIITKDDYKDIIEESSQNMTIDELHNKALADGYSPMLADYYREFLIRAANPDNFTYENAIEYTELFMVDVDQQSALTASEKDQMKTAISVYQNSLQYWNYTLK